MNMVAFNRFTGLNPFEVREVSKLNWFGKHAWFYVLIPLRSGKFLNLVRVIHSYCEHGLNPFEVREVSKQGHLTLSRLERLNPFEVREVSKQICVISMGIISYVLIPLRSGKFLNHHRQWWHPTFVGLNPFEVREVSKQVFTNLAHTNQWFIF